MYLQFIKYSLLFIRTLRGTLKCTPSSENFDQCTCCKEVVRHFAIMPGEIMFNNLFYLYKDVIIRDKKISNYGNQYENLVYKISVSHIPMNNFVSIFIDAITEVFASPYFLYYTQLELIAKNIYKAAVSTSLSVDDLGVFTSIAIFNLIEYNLLENDFNTYHSHSLVGLMRIPAVDYSKALTMFSIDDYLYNPQKLNEFTLETIKDEQIYFKEACSTLSIGTGKFIGMATLLCKDVEHKLNNKVFEEIESGNFIATNLEEKKVLYLVNLYLHFVNSFTSFNSIF